MGLDYVPPLQLPNPGQHISSTTTTTTATTTDRMNIDMDRFVAMDLDKEAKLEMPMLHGNNGATHMYPTNLIIDTSVVSLYSSNATTPTGTATTASTVITTATSTATATVSSTASSSVSQTAVQSASRTTCLTPEPPNKAEADRDIIWQVLLDLSRVVIEAKKDHQLLAAEIEDLMHPSHSRHGRHFTELVMTCTRTYSGEKTALIAGYRGLSPSQRTSMNHPDLIWSQECQRCPGQGSWNWKEPTAHWKGNGWSVFIGSRLWSAYCASAGTNVPTCPMTSMTGH
ncbi:MAG: hypothetical protein BYD32DRAFT_263067 [Podila humilis]|nr:MAG: hypothetical protein BYD32DRAFT_263067 [Podila humilis]